MTYELHPPIGALRGAALLLWEWAVRLDEPIQAMYLLNALPYPLADDPAIGERRKITAALLRHLQSPAAYADFYAKIWEGDPPVREGIEAYARTQARMVWALEECHRVKARHVIDLGSGPGVLTLFLASHGFETIGVNLTAKAVEACNASAKAFDLPARFVLGHAEQMIAPEDLADVVIAFEIVEHVGNPAELVAAMERVVRPGGLCLMSTPNGSTTIGEDTWRTRDENGGVLGDPVAHVRVFTPARMVEWLGQRPNFVCTVSPGPGAGSLHVRWERPAA